jgi:hypothetical protein
MYFGDRYFADFVLYVCSDSHGWFECASALVNWKVITAKQQQQ